MNWCRFTTTLWRGSADGRRSAALQDSAETLYAGFWLRVWASLIDTVLLLLIIVPLLWVAYGADYFAPTGAIFADRWTCC